MLYDNDENLNQCSYPIDITTQVMNNKLPINYLYFSWAIDQKQFIISVFTSKKLTCEDLVNKLKERRPRETEKTIELIKTCMSNDTDLDVDSFVITINDPLRQKKMTLLARAKNCIHLQCFDAIQFIKMQHGYVHFVKIKFILEILKLMIFFGRYFKTQN